MAAGTGEAANLAEEDVRRRLGAGRTRSAGRGSARRICPWLCCRFGLAASGSAAAAAAVAAAGSEWLTTFVGELGAQVLLMKSSKLHPSYMYAHLMRYIESSAQMQLLQVLGLSG